MGNHCQRYWCQGVALAIATVANIANPAFAELLVSPETVTLAGDRTSSLSTTLTLSEDSEDQEGSTLKAAVSDLRRADSAASISADEIAIEPAELEIPEDAPEQIQLTIDLANTSASGEFTGALYLYTDDGRQVVPLTVRVKAAPWWPWHFMIVGVGLGAWLSIYKAEGQSRDELLVQVSRLQNRMDSDHKLHQDFRTSINTKLEGTVSAIEDKDWGKAKTEVAAAKDLWRVWLEFRDDWVTQLSYGDQRRKDLSKAQDFTIYMQSVKDTLDGIYRKLRTGQYLNPEVLREEFSTVRNQLSFYRTAKALLDQLKEDRHQLSDKRDNIWLNVLERLERKLNNLEPTSEKEQKAWYLSFEDAQQKLKTEIAAEQNAVDEYAVSLIIQGRSGAIETKADPVPPVPVVTTFQLGPGIKAQRNLWWFNQTNRAVAIIFLAWLGMTALYSSKPTFGADPMRDYLAILAWGFGAELTRESVVKATQSLGLPLGSE